MKRDLPSYTNFRDSGIPWIGVIPSHWEIRQLGFISNRVLVGVVINPSSYVSDEGVPFLLGGDIQEFKIDTKNCNYCPREVSDGPLRKSRLTAGDLVVVRVGYPGVAAVIPPELEGANCASMMLIRKHPRFCSQWLAYVFNSQIGRDQVGIVQYGAAQKQFNISHAVKFRFPFPPIDEQNVIAAFLDLETAKIDRLADVRRKQIECLQEQRAAVIHHAMTKGLDPAAKMKPSGVEWLGDIPETWQTNKLRYLVTFKGGGTPSKGVSSYWEGDIPWVSPKDMKSLEISDAEDHIAMEALADSASSLIDEGCLLMVVRSGILRHSIPVAINTKKVALNQDIKAFQLKKFLDARFLMFLVLGNEDQLLTLWRKQGSTVESLEHHLIANTYIAIPEPTEQQAIVAYIDTETAKLYTLISKYRRELDLLAEYRASLISHAVTGKIDVRGMVEIPG
jgi:type I restriction enzyme S subunit